MKTKEEIAVAIDKMRVTLATASKMAMPDATYIASGMLDVLLWVTGESDYFGSYLQNIQQPYDTIRKTMETLTEPKP